MLSRGSLGKFRKNKHKANASLHKVVEFLKKYFTGSYTTYVTDSKNHSLYYYVSNLTINANEDKIKCDLRHANGPSFANYEDQNENLRNFSHALTCELRDLMDKNVYFDIRRGKITIFI